MSPLEGKGTMAPPEQQGTGSGEDPARRDRRAATFAAELTAAWRTELACLWERPEADAEVPGAAAFRGRVEALRQLAAKEGADVAAIQGLTQGLHGAAQALKADPRVRRWMAATAIRGDAGARDGFRPAPPAAPRPAPGGVGVVKELLAELGPRLAAVRVALEKDPTRAAGWAALPGELKLVVPGLAVALASAPAAATLARQALQHYDVAQAAIAAQDPARLRGVVMPLNQLHVAFREVPALARLFPPPRTRALPAAPARPTGPVAPPSRGVTGPVPKPVAPPKPAPGSRGTGLLPGAVGGPAVPKPAASSLAPDVRIAADGTRREAALSLPKAAPAPAPVAPEPEISFEEEAPSDPMSPVEVSKRRMAAIAGYLKDPEADPLLRDPMVVFRLVSDEHAYQGDQVAHLRMLISLLPPTADPARRAQLTAEQASCAKRQRQLYELLKRITARGRPP